VNALAVRVGQSRFLRFLIVGGFGFFVDAGVLWLMLHGAGVDKYSGRAVSFLCSATFTWWGNRNLTFADRKAHGTVAVAEEWLKFLAANAVGGAVNLGLYTVLVTFAAAPFSNPFAALPCGVLAGLLFNFTMSRLVVFRDPA
jgi:putative flippase GtrA